MTVHQVPALMEPPVWTMWMGLPVLVLKSLQVCESMLVSSISIHKLNDDLLLIKCYRNAGFTISVLIY